MESFKITIQSFKSVIEKPSFVNLKSGGAGFGFGRAGC